MTTADPIGTWPDTGSEHRQLVGLLGDLRTQHARHARCEQREDLQELTRQGLLLDVVVDGEWAGIIAGEPDNRRGVSHVRAYRAALSPGRVDVGGEVRIACRG